MKQLVAGDPATDGRVVSGATASSFFTDHLEPGDALEAWRAEFGGLNDVIPAEGAPFAASVSFWRLGPIVLSSNRSSAVRLVRPAARARCDGFDHWVLRVSRHGVVRSRSGDRAYVSRPGELVLEKLSEPYEDEWSDDRWVAAIVSPGVFPDLDRRLAALPPGPVAGGRAALLADYLLALDQRLPGMSHADLAAIAEMMPTMIAALSPPGAANLRRAASLERLRVEKIIRANIGSARLDSRRIAALAGISRSTLYRLFDDADGVSAHVRRLRLEAAYAALGDATRRGERISAIAAQSGFHCTTAFNRSFKRRFGVTPGEVRAGASHASEFAPASFAPPGGDFLDLLLGPARKGVAQPV